MTQTKTETEQEGNHCYVAKGPATPKEVWVAFNPDGQIEGAFVGEAPRAATWTFVRYVRA